jgi:uncharacterized cysteine cluster protein YcgN (CxxCxxCC family)
MAGEKPFWRTKRLDEMTREEWESLCDGCGRCCLHKLRDEETERVHFTNVACRLLDLGTCRCKDYPRRQVRVPDCVALSPRELAEIDWLPPSCAYHLLAKGQELPDWHPLISGDPESVARAGVSVAGRVVAERDAGDLEHHVVAWPGRMPQARAPKTQSRRR